VTRPGQDLWSPEREEDAQKEHQKVKNPEKKHKNEQEF